MIAFSIIIGMNNVFNTQVNKAAGLGDIKLCLLYLKRSQLILTISFIPIFIILLQT
jgi:hypothetical protein